ncbi:MULTISPECIES: P-II family nitrogen regulator [Prosthecochloris]|uniref:P-II family nitrogen regulator n=1 Tax=Prosthecochloris vibrioformis TaxID=1098 RepID=A0A5C4RZS9_PROVB|nr:MULTISPECIES: P-II family nitrogen regulator [Prosthecochloris]ANT63907.1 Nitrogen regulatory protein P-II [Prosthecochloris sp. CIB 2401]TNJ36505.1 P-II family nitrogen regulator [Prosthecochloris vibrioformis]
MKLITAIIQEDRLDNVREALIQADITRISVSRISGHGRQEDIEIYRGRRIAPNLLPKIKIEIAVNEAFVDPAIDAIIASARHGEGQIGDGKIFVTPLEECVRIRTRERGCSAI